MKKIFYKLFGKFVIKYRLRIIAKFENIWTYKYSRQLRKLLIRKPWLLKAYTSKRYARKIEFYYQWLKSFVKTRYGRRHINLYKIVGSKLSQ